MNDPRLARLPVAPDPLTCFALADLIILAAQLFLPPARLRSLPAPETAGLTESWLRLGVDDAGARATAYEQLWRRLGGHDEGAGRGAYEQLFATGQVAPINEAAYIRRDKGALLGDISGFYRAFGIELRPGVGERPDHLVSELEYLGLCLVMLGNAILEPPSETAEAADTTWLALRSFADDHLGAWLPSFVERTAFAAGLGPHAEAADYLAGLWQVLCDRLQLGGGEAGLVPLEEDSEPGWACAGGDAPSAS